MARFKTTAEFYNFICHFGNLELLDYLENIVLPAFLNPGIAREWGKSAYFLLNVKPVELTVAAKKHPAIVGRFVLDTELSRTQVFENGKLVERPGSMKTAPSSMFALLLDTHKLLFAKEVAGGPGIASFRTTIELLLNRQRINLINHEHKIAKLRQKAGEGPKVTKQMLSDSIPRADLKILPLTGESGIVEFLARFTVLKELHIRVVKRNSELDNDELFDDIQSASQEVGAEQTTLVHRNPEGLKKDAAAKQAVPAMHGNAEVVFRGIGQNAEKLSGTNDDFKVVSQPLDLPEDPESASKLMLSIFNTMLSEGLIKVANGQVSAANAEKLKKWPNG